MEARVRMMTPGERNTLGRRPDVWGRVRRSSGTFADVVAGIPAPRTWKGWIILLLTWPGAEWAARSMTTTGTRHLLTATLPWVPATLVIVGVVGWWQRRNGWDFWGSHRRRHR